jgi:hypothetical protein
MGTQPHNGNKWNLPTVSGFGGINLSQTGWVPLSRFDVDSLLGSVYNPMVTPSSWFNPTNGGNTFYCYSSTVCSSPPPALSDTTIRDLIELGIFDSEEISEEAKAIAQEYIYRELADDSALWISDSTYIQFMLDNQEKPVAYLYNADEYLKAAYMYDSTLMALIDSCNLQIRLFTDSVTMYSSGTGVGTIKADSLKLVWRGHIDFLNQTINNIKIQSDALIKDKLDSAQYINDIVISDKIPEQNTVTINNIEIHYLETEQDKQVLIDNYNELLSIANQCPFVGGAAVERARSFVAMLNDSVVYNDDYVCLQSGVYRISTTDSLIENANSIIVKPNPASDKVEVKLVGKFKGICKIEFINVLGEIVLSDEMNCNETLKSINVSFLPQSIYTIKVYINNQVSLINKVAIIR